MPLRPARLQGSALPLGLALLLALAAQGCDTTVPGTEGPRPAPTTVTAYVPPMSTYLRTSNDNAARFATARRLDAFGLRPGDTACFEAFGDFDAGGGVRGSARGVPLVIGVFARQLGLAEPGERFRVRGALAAGVPVTTPPTTSLALPTDIPEDFNATSGCLTVPAGAAFLYLSVFDDYFSDNRLFPNEERVGVRVTRR